MEKDQEPQGGLWQEKDTVTPPTHPILTHWGLRTLKPPLEGGPEMYFLCKGGQPAKKADHLGTRYVAGPAFKHPPL